MRATLLFLLVLFGTTRAIGCTCHWPAEFSNDELSFDLLIETPLIIHATVVDTINPAERWYGLQLVHLRVLRTYKGVDDSTLVIYNYSYSGNCDHGYRVGEDYLFFLQPDTANGFDLAFCSGVLDMSLEHDPRWEARLGRVLQQLETYREAPMQPLRVKYSNGKALAQGRLVNGIPEGHWREFTYDGQVEFEGEFENGKRVGIWKKYTDPRMDDGKWGPGMEPQLTKPMVANFNRGTQLSFWTNQGEPPIPITR